MIFSAYQTGLNDSKIDGQTEKLGILVRFRSLSMAIFGKELSIGWPCVLIVFCLFVILIISCFVFRSLFGFRLLQFMSIANLLP